MLWKRHFLKEKSEICKYVLWVILHALCDIDCIFLHKKLYIVSFALLSKIPKTWSTDVKVFQQRIPCSFCIQKVVKFSHSIIDLTRARHFSLGIALFSIIPSHHHILLLVNLSWWSTKIFGLVDLILSSSAFLRRPMLELRRMLKFLITKDRDSPVTTSSCLSTPLKLTAFHCCTQSNNLDIILYFSSVCCLLQVVPLHILVYYTDLTVLDNFHIKSIKLTSLTSLSTPPSLILHKSTISPKENWPHNALQSCDPDIVGNPQTDSKAGCADV